MANDIYLKVAPEGLKQKAKVIEGQIKSIAADWNTLRQIVTNSRTYWSGEASRQHQKEFNGIVDDMELILKRLNEHPRDLMIMAGVYDESDKTAQEIASLLSGDIIL